MLEQPKLKNSKCQRQSEQPPHVVAHRSQSHYHHFAVRGEKGEEAIEERERTDLREIKRKERVRQWKEKEKTNLILRGRKRNNIILVVAHYSELVLLAIHCYRLVKNFKFSTIDVGCWVFGVLK